MNKPFTVDEAKVAAATFETACHGRTAATLRAYADMIDRKRAVYASALEAWEARKAAFGQWGLNGTVTQRAFDEGYIAAHDRQGERIERLRVGMRHDSTCKKNESRLMACTCGLDTLLKEDDSHA